jgi:clathrin heavy chain
MQMERRNRLRLLLPWLEVRVAQGVQEPALHNAVGKIYITLNRDPLNFLQNNQYYDHAVIGAFCEKLDPHLAFVAYKHANGACDDALVKVTQENGLFKDLARYLVEKQDVELWCRVLQPEGYNAGDPEPPSRRYLLDQVVQTALPETHNPDEVSTTVKAFMQCDMPGELIELLERIVLQGSDFSNNKNLQNLLILTAIRAAKEKVMEFINRLDNFDGPDIAKIAVQEQYQLYEEALTIYIKFGKKSMGEEQLAHHVAAVEVLVDHIKDLERAKEFAERVNASAVWSKLARAQLNNSLVKDSIESYIKAKDPADYLDVISAAEAVENYEDLVSYLKMARKTIKEAYLDTELIYALARVHKLTELEEIISVPNVAKIDQIGERCFDEGMYEAAKILFMNINNNAKLALCYVKMNMFREAVDAATKANSLPTWKEVNLSCLKANEYRLANVCGLHIIVHPDHLEELIGHYERMGRTTELLALMEQGLGLDHAHAGIFTELGVLYTKYMPDKLMEHIKIFHSKMNIVKLLRACERALMWTETVYLYKEDNQHDSAVRTMVEHPVAFKHELFLECVQKVRNPEVHYKAISFYVAQHPMLLSRLLQVLTPHLDHARVVVLLKKSDGMHILTSFPYDSKLEFSLSHPASHRVPSVGSERQLVCGERGAQRVPRGRGRLRVSPRFYRRIRQLRPNTAGAEVGEARASRIPPPVCIHLPPQPAPRAVHRSLEDGPHVQGLHRHGGRVGGRRGRRRPPSLFCVGQRQGLLRCLDVYLLRAHISRCGGGARLETRIHRLHYALHVLCPFYRHFT